MTKKAVLLCLIIFSFCAPKEKIQISPPISDYESKLKEADALYEKGCYICLKQAFQIYQDLYAVSSYKEKVAEKFVKTSLLITVREKELGIIDGAYLDKALQAIKENSFLTDLMPYVEITDLIRIEVKGVMKDIDESFPWRESREKLKKIQNELKGKAESDDFFAYMYASLNCSYSSFLREKKDFSEFLKVYPESLLIKYKIAICPKEKPELLEEIIKEEPNFYETYYYLGEVALKKRDLFEAEGYFLKTSTRIPKSVSTTISLATIYFYTEELEKSLEFYKKTLEIAPEYRDALLGEAICMSYMGRHTEAIAILDRLLALGKWYLGETHYWLAWNQHELRNNEEAALNVEKAKAYLPMNSEVFTLSGIIAFERGELERAEKNLKQALEFEPSNCEALFYLGKLCAQREDWRNSGTYFEKAGFAFEKSEESIKERIHQIEISSLPEERKRKLILKRENQLRKTVLSKATTFYNAAAGYFNAGLKEEALASAMKAASHPLFKQKAEELITRIKNLN